MKEMAHTPGPWAVEADMRSVLDWSNDEYLAGWNIVSASGADVVGIEGIIPGGNAEADATVMAAAPELLKACLEAQQYLSGSTLPGGQEIYEELTAAIAKALLTQQTKEQGE